MNKQPFTVPLLAHAGDEIANINMQGGRVGENAINYTCNHFSLFFTYLHMEIRPNNSKPSRH
jgi:hypothetical protein